MSCWRWRSVAFLSVRLSHKLSESLRPVMSWRKWADRRIPHCRLISHLRGSSRSFQIRALAPRPASESAPTEPALFTFLYFPSAILYYSSLAYNTPAAPAGVAEWQTRRTQNPLPARACGFDSLLRQYSFSSPPALIPSRFASASPAAPSPRPTPKPPAPAPPSPPPAPQRHTTPSLP